ncbi:pentatricopeptide repeat-containing protein At1g03540 [Aristolochia californica]|uniref:pentatricopeptide repeat-containing protein At1g03540 n=1 Tax=Aristolochia californica TaxID=171875 RepID=UPI0035E2708A
MTLFQRYYYCTLLKQDSGNYYLQSRILHLCNCGYLYQALHLLNSIDLRQIAIKPVLFASLLQTCIKTVAIKPGLQIHSYIIKSGLEFDRFVGNSLLSMYFKLSTDFRETQRVFDNLPFRDVISWTSLISGYVRHGKPIESLKFFQKMAERGVEPNAFTLSATIKGCSELADIRFGTGLHGIVLSRGFDANQVVACALVDMYGRTANIESAHQVFGEIFEPDSICWTSMISAFTRNDMFQRGLHLFYLMQRKYCLLSDSYTFGSILTACGNLRRLKNGKEIHGKVVTCGIGGDVFVESSVVDMYGKCRSVEDSRRVFDRMLIRNSVSWSALLGAYCENGHCNAVLGLFRDMEKQDDHYSFGTVLRACAGLTDVRHGKEVHCQYLRRMGWKDVIVECALVDLYSKCGYVEYAQRVFSSIVVRNLITWNSMICGFAQNGKVNETIQLFNEMVRTGTQPDYISFIGVLSACSYSGRVEEGREYFKLMTEDYGIHPEVEHYNCMVDLLGRAGLVEEAENLIKKSVVRDDSSLLVALLGACASHPNVSVAERVAKRLMKLEPDSHLSYTLIGNVYKAVGMWDQALKIRKLMEEKGIRKTPGKSWIEVKNSMGSCLNRINFDVSKVQSNGIDGFLLEVT